jgi:hypothetical protein
MALREKITEEKKQLKEEILNKDRQIVELKSQLQAALMPRFHDIYGEFPDETMKKYVKRLRECCGQGGRGYAWWLGGIYAAQEPTYHHCVVIDYEKAQPTQQERDAYWIITESEMKVTEIPHIERWGN